jgi:hypothetical protein
VRSEVDDEDDGLPHCPVRKARSKKPGRSQLRCVRVEGLFYSLVCNCMSNAHDAGEMGGPWHAKGLDDPATLMPPCIIISDSVLNVDGLKAISQNLAGTKASESDRC